MSRLPGRAPARHPGARLDAHRAGGRAFVPCRRRFGDRVFSAAGRPSAPRRRRRPSSRRTSDPSSNAGGICSRRSRLPYPRDGAKVAGRQVQRLSVPAVQADLHGLWAHPREVPALGREVLDESIFPLDPKCKPVDRQPGASSGLRLPAAAAVMARSKDTFDKLTSWFFEHQEELSPATVRRAAAEIGGIADYDAQYAKAAEAVKARRHDGRRSLASSSTPTFFINGRRDRGRAAAAVFRGCHRARAQTRGQSRAPALTGNELPATASAPESGC